MTRGTSAGRSSTSHGYTTAAFPFRCPASRPACPPGRRAHAVRTAQLHFYRQSLHRAGGPDRGTDAPCVGVRLQLHRYRRRAVPVLPLRATERLRSGRRSTGATAGRLRRRVTPAHGRRGDRTASGRPYHHAHVARRLPVRRRSLRRAPPLDLREPSRRRDVGCIDDPGHRPACALAAAGGPRGRPPEDAPGRERARVVAALPR